MARAGGDGIRMSDWDSGHQRQPSRAHTSVWHRKKRPRDSCFCKHLEFELTTSLTDKKCPFTGMVSIRGRILTGTVVSTKMHRTLIIRREYLHFVPKYSRYEKRHKNLAAHVSPAFRVEEGDQVTVGQCRPLSKTVRTILSSLLNRASILTEMDCRFGSMFYGCYLALARQ